MNMEKNKAIEFEAKSFNDGVRSILEKLVNKEIDIDTALDNIVVDTIVSASVYDAIEKEYATE